MIGRAIKHWWQRRVRGWDDSDTWDLESTLARWLVPRLKRFKEVTNGFPGGLTEEKWDEYLDKMILAFTLIGEEWQDWDTDEEKVKQVNEGLDLFREYFFDLWW